MTNQTKGEQGNEKLGNHHWVQEDHSNSLKPGRDPLTQTRHKSHVELFSLHSRGTSLEGLLEQTGHGPGSP